MSAVAEHNPIAERNAHSPFVSDADINAMCDPLTQPAAQIRYLKEQLGLKVATKRNGRPLLMKSELERVLGAPRLDAIAQVPGTTTPNVTALAEYFRKKSRGTSS